MKKRYIVLGGVLLAALIFAGTLFLPRIGQFQAAFAESKVRRDVSQAGVQVQTSGEGYVSPVDFEALRKRNSDIYAWLYIPGAGISEPLLQRDGDSSYYAAHNSLGGLDSDGALFTESEYCVGDFSEPAVVIYGKNTRTERLFYDLQSAYSSNAGLRDNSEIIVYLPEEEIHYTAFAAAPFRNYNISYYFNFYNEKRFQTFLDLIESIRTVDAHWNDEAQAAVGDQLLILSTARSGSSTNSYLVLAKRS